MDKFRIILLELSKDLTKEDLRRMKFSLRDIIPAGIMETIETPTDLFMQLETLGHLSSENRHLVADMFQRLGRSDLRSKLLEIRAPEIISSNKTVDEYMMYEIAEEIGSRWKSLGRELRLREAIIDNIEADYPRSVRDRAFQVMLRWKQMNGSKATEGDLAKALVKIGRTDIAQKLSGPNKERKAQEDDGFNHHSVNSDQRILTDQNMSVMQRTHPQYTYTGIPATQSQYRSGVSETGHYPTDGFARTTPQYQVGFPQTAPLYRGGFPDAGPQYRGGVPDTGPQYRGGVPDAVPQNTGSPLRGFNMMPSDQHTWTIPRENNQVYPDSGVTSPQGHIVSINPFSESQVKIGSYLNPQKYSIEKLLGSGSFAKVFLVRCLKYVNKEYMAVKQVDLGMNDPKTQEMVDALKKEWRIMKDMKNEYILTVYGLEEESNTLNLFMEWMPGGSIHQWLQHNKPQTGIPDNRMRSYTMQILKGLEYLHTNTLNKIIHRDIKGQNILIGEDVERVKLADFGISEKMELLIKATNTGYKGKDAQLGSVYWKSPELINADPFDERCDIWSLGCTLFEMATGNPPYGNLQPIQAATKITQIGVQPPDGCPTDMADFLSLCFKDWRNRPRATSLLSHPFITGEEIEEESPLL